MELFTELKKEIKEIKERLNTIEGAQTADLLEDANKRTDSELGVLSLAVFL